MAPCRNTPLSVFPCRTDRPTGVAADRCLSRPCGKRQARRPLWTARCPRRRVRQSEKALPTARAAPCRSVAPTTFRHERTAGVRSRYRRPLSLRQEDVSSPDCRADRYKRPWFQRCRSRRRGNDGHPGGSAVASEPSLEASRIVSRQRVHRFQRLCGTRAGRGSQKRGGYRRRPTLPRPALEWWTSRS